MISDALTFNEFRTIRIKRKAKCKAAINGLCEPVKGTICDDCWEHIVVEQLNQKKGGG
jgi:hypothetical protein